MTRRLTSALLAAALLPIATAPAVASSPDRSQPTPRAAATVRILETSSPFSPNGDGHHDRVAVRYRLSGEARVSVEVTSRGRTILHTAPKGARAGTRSFGWDGTGSSGRRAADGRYRVVVRATAHGTARSDSTTVVVRTTPSRIGAGTLKLSSDTVYPYARVIHDVVIGNFHLTSPLATGGKEVGYPAPVLDSARAQVLDRTGHVIAVERVTTVTYRADNTMDGPVSCGPCGRFIWDGRDSDGVRQAPGAYRIRVVQGRDSAGNTRVLSSERTVRISRKQLVPKTTVLDLLASEAPRTSPPPSGCLGCDFVTCYTSSSTRFPGGLTFDRTPPRCLNVTEMFTVPVPGRRTPEDSFTVWATGGPSTAGASASAVLSAGAYSPREWTMTGDRTTSAAQDMTPNSEVYGDDWPEAVVWSVSGSTGSYDIASFRVQLQTYVPAA